MCLQGSELTSLKQANIYQFAKKNILRLAKVKRECSKINPVQIFNCYNIEIDTIYQTYPYLIHEK